MLTTSSCPLQAPRQAHSLLVLPSTRRGDGSNALILPATKASASTAAGPAAAAAQQQPLSKSQLKKLKQVQLKKERREQLSQVRLGRDRCCCLVCSCLIALCTHHFPFGSCPQLST
jgi:hypothetical protein